MKHILLTWLLCIKLIHLSVVKGFVGGGGGGIGDIIGGGGGGGGGIGDIPYIDQIPSIVSEVNNIPSIVSQVNNIPHIVSQVNNIPSIVSQVNNVPHIVSQVNNIPEMITAISGITNTANSIKELAEDIPEIVEDVVEILDDVKAILEKLTSPFSIGSIDPRIKSLGNTLQICLQDLTDAVIGDLPFSDLLNPPDINILGIDIEAIIYQLIAIPLLPIKSQIEFVCIDNIDDIKSAINAIKNLQSLSRRRAMNMDEFMNSKNNNTNRRRGLYTNDDCEPDNDGFCEPAEIPENALLQVTSVLVAVGCFAPSLDPKLDTCWGPVNGAWKITELVFTFWVDIIKGTCAKIQACAADVLSECIPAMQCVKSKEIVEWTKWVAMAVSKIIDVHNEQIHAGRTAAFRADRFNIIHNQYALKKMIRESTVGITNSIESGTRTEVFYLKQIKKTVEELKADFTDQYGAQTVNEGMIDIERNTKQDVEMNIDEKSFINKLTPNDWYMFGLISTIFLVVNAMITSIVVFVMLKCCNGNSGHHFTAVAKYDYSTSDVDELNK
eukprot:520810_1